MHALALQDVDALHLAKGRKQRQDVLLGGGARDLRAAGVAARMGAVIRERRMPAWDACKPIPAPGQGWMGPQQVPALPTDSRGSMPWRPSTLLSCNTPAARDHLADTTCQAPAKSANSTHLAHEKLAWSDGALAHRGAHRPSRLRKGRRHLGLVLLGCTVMRAVSCRPPPHAVLLHALASAGCACGTPTSRQLLLHMKHQCQYT